MASTVGITTSTTSIRLPAQRNSFHAAGRFWVLYCLPGTNDLVYRTSIDGISWSDVNEIAPLTGENGWNYDVCFDETYVHYVRNISTSGAGITAYGLMYRRGTPQSDGTISWSAVEQTALADGNIAIDISICIDSNGYPWVAYGAKSPDGNPTVTASSTNDGTWSTESGYPLRLIEQDYDMTFLLPQTNGKLVAIIYSTRAAVRRIRARFYNGSEWSAIEYATPNSNDGKLSTNYYALLCGIAIDDEIHLVYHSYDYTYNYIRYVHGTSGNWSGLTLLADTYIGPYCTPVIASDGNDLYVFWLGNDDHVYYRKYSGSWETIVDWIDETTDSFYRLHLLQCFYKSYDGYIGLSYQTLPSSPYNVRFAFLTVPAGWTLTISSTLGGITEPVLGSYPHIEGKTIEVIAIPEAGYLFDHWEGDIAGSENPVTFTIMADMTITAVFSEIIVPPEEHAVTISVIGKGTTDPLPGAYTVAVGAILTVIAYPAEGWVFDHWEGDVSGTMNPMDVEVLANISVVAIFMGKPAPLPLWPLGIGIAGFAFLAVITHKIRKRR